MKFLVIIFTLLIVYSTNWATQIRHLPVFSGYLRVMEKFFQWLKITSEKTKLFLSFVIFLFVLSIVLDVLRHDLFGVLTFIIDMLVLLYCLANARLMDQVGKTQILTDAIQQLFSILFWFILFGPLGAVLYVFNDMLSRRVDFASVSWLTLRLQAWLDWIPSRLLGFCFALIGNFSTVFPYWVKCALTSSGENLNFLLGCFDQIINGDEVLFHEPALVDEYLKKLIYRSLLLWLVVLAVLVLIG